MHPSLDAQIYRYIHTQKGGITFINANTYTDRCIRYIIDKSHKYYTISKESPDNVKNHICKKLIIGAILQFFLNKFTYCIDLYMYKFTVKQCS